MSEICSKAPHKSPEVIWEMIKEQAILITTEEAVLTPVFAESILKKSSLAEAISSKLARKLASASMTSEVLEPILTKALLDIPQIVNSATADLLAIEERDPACHHLINPLLFYKGFHAISTYRIAHQFWKADRHSLALYLQSLASEAFGVDIHPAAEIGCGILLDHATSFVVGETAIIEDNVSILHEVTLGGTGKECGNRHPVVRSGVLLGAGAKVLGRVEIGQNAKIGAGSVVLEDVSPNTTVAGVPAKVMAENQINSPAEAMDQSLDSMDG